MEGDYTHCPVGSVHMRETSPDSISSEQKLQCKLNQPGRQSSLNLREGRRAYIAVWQAEAPAGGFKLLTTRQYLKHPSKTARLALVLGSQRKQPPPSPLHLLQFRL